MSQAVAAARERTRKCELPPLILHPFGTTCSDEHPVDMPGSDSGYLSSRYAEVRMLCYIGRDLTRWLEQCVESVGGANPGGEITEGIFISQLLFDPPPLVVRKMQDWGIGSFQIIFSRALGLNTMYAFPPEPRQLSDDFLRNFHSYADALFDVRLKRHSLPETGMSFDFDLYASSEYSSMLEKSWEQTP
jgi:hypothetical protein